MRLDVHVHIHGERDSAILDKLDMILKKVKNMATKQDFDDLIAAFNDATNKIALRIQALEDKVAGGGLTPEEESATLAELASVRASLEALGADPENPVPAA